MGKFWKTKRKILRIIEKRAKTTSEISSELKLSPSTVSEHMYGLEKVGAVRRVENPFVKKWKYFIANSDFS